MSNPRWITDHSGMAEALDNLSSGDTFALKTNESWGEMKKYVRVTDGNRRDYSEMNVGEPHDIVLKGEVGKSPSADHFDSMAISHDPNDGIVYWKKGVGRFERLSGVSLHPLSVSFESEATTAARCECGQTTKIRASKENASPTLEQRMERDEDGNLITPCCRSTNWTTVLVDDA